MRKTKEVVRLNLTVKTEMITLILARLFEQNKDLNILAGIKTCGVFIAHRIKERLEQLENITVPGIGHQAFLR